MTVKDVALAVLVILVITLGGISFFEYSVLQSSRTAASTSTAFTTNTVVTETSTATTTSTVVVTATSVPDAYLLDQLKLFGINYTKWDATTQNNFTFDKVQFSRWTNSTVNVTMECPDNVYGGWIMKFQDGTSERFGDCLPTISPITVLLTHHTNPQAGLIILSDLTVYFLVK